MPGKSTTFLRARIGKFFGRESALTSNDGSPRGSIGIMLISALAGERSSLNMSFILKICMSVNALSSSAPILTKCHCLLGRRRGPIYGQ